MPSEFGFGPRSPRYGPCLVSGGWCTLRRFWGFLDPFGSFLGHIVKFKGTRGLFYTVKSSCTWSAPTVSLRLGVSPGFGGYFGRKMAVFGPKLHRFGRAPPDLAPPLRAATGEFLAQNLDLLKPPARLQDGQSRVKPEVLGECNGQNGIVTCLVVVACCLLFLLLVS